MERMTSRKFWTMIALQVVAVILVWFGKIDGTAYVAMTTLLTGSYFTANVAEKPRQ